MQASGLLEFKCVPLPCNSFSGFDECLWKIISNNITGLSIKSKDS